MKYNFSGHDLSSVLGMIFGVILAFIILCVISALVVKFAWWLFAVPVFGLPSLSLTQAFGLGMLLNTGHAIKYSKS